MSDMARELIEKPVTSSEGTSDSKYKGVRKRKWGKWVSEIRLPNSRDRIWLGSYDSAEKAARAFDAAQFCLRGCNARFNFPDNPPDIAGGRSLTPPEIQLAASRFANSSAPEPPRRNGDDDQSASMCDLQTESPSPSLSISDGTAAMDCDLVDGPPFSDLLTGNMGSGNYASDYGLYPGYDDFCNDYFAPPLPGNNHQGFTGEDNFDGVLVQDSFLWNF